MAVIFFAVGALWSTLLVNIRNLTGFTEFSAVFTVVGTPRVVWIVAHAAKVHFSSAISLIAL